jgi:hypothetical protein
MMKEHDLRHLMVISATKWLVTSLVTGSHAGTKVCPYTLWPIYISIHISRSMSFCKLKLRVLNSRSPISFPWEMPQSSFRRSHFEDPRNSWISLILFPFGIYMWTDPSHDESLFIHPLCNSGTNFGGLCDELPESDDREMWTLPK